MSVSLPSSSLCTICQGAGSSSAPIVRCRGSCHLSFHLSCYGADLTSSELDLFVCDYCSFLQQRRLSAQPLPEAPTCRICRNSMRNTPFINRSNNGKIDEFVHSVCALFEDQQKDSEIPSSSAVCFVGCDKKGLRISCCWPGCKFVMHPSCAFNRGKIIRRGSLDRVDLLCGLHREKSFPAAQDEKNEKPAEVKNQEKNKIPERPQKTPAIPERPVEPVEKAKVSLPAHEKIPEVSQVERREVKETQKIKKVEKPEQPRPAEKTDKNDKNDSDSSDGGLEMLAKRQRALDAIKQAHQRKRQREEENQTIKKTTMPAPVNPHTTEQPSPPDDFPISSEFASLPGAEVRIVSGWEIVKQLGETEGGSGDACQVCGDPWEYEDDAILLCSNEACKYCAHQTCNGEPNKIPEGDWFCKLCELGGRMGRTRCAICNTEKLGPMKKIVASQAKILGRGEWAHIACALWTPGCSFTDDDRSEICVPPSFDPSFLVRCDLCGLTGGFVTVCNYGSCQVKFHGQCAVREGLELQNNYDEKENRCIQGFCKAHDPNDKFQVRARKISRLRNFNSAATDRRRKRIRRSADDLIDVGSDDSSGSDSSVYDRRKSKSRFPVSLRSSVAPRISRVAEIRQNAFKPLAKALGGDEELAEQIDAAVWHRHADEISKYSQQVRNLAHNLINNAELLAHVKSGKIEPQTVAEMTNAEMATKALQDARRLAHKENLKEKIFVAGVTTVRDLKTGEIRYFHEGKIITQEMAAQIEREKKFQHNKSSNSGSRQG